MTLTFTALQFVAGFFISVATRPFPALPDVPFAESNAAGKYEMNARCTAAYDAMLKCQFVKADSLLNVELQQNPSNLLPWFIANYKDYILIAFNENRKDYDAWKHHEDERLDKLKSGDKSSPYHLFTQAEVSLQWAIINLKFENYTAAFWNVRSAFNDLTANKKKFPDFVANDKSLGVLHALIGATPDSYKWAAKLMGFSGTISQGVREVRNVIDHGNRNPDFAFTDEAKYMYLFLQVLLLNDVAGAYQSTESKSFPSHTGNPISCFMKGYIAMKHFNNDKAIEYFRYNNDHNKTILHYNAYMLGMTMLNKLDYNAETYLAKFCNQFRGSNYIKDAFLRRGWIKLLNSNRDGYFDMLSNIPVRGIQLTDSDKAAAQAAKTKLIPNLTLLKARLLMDGGYYKLALNQLSGKSASDFSTVDDKTEFAYRAGRIYQLSGNDDKAIAFFKETIARGSKLPTYYAASAALEAGNIYERQKNYAEAKKYFQLCLDMPDSDFKNSLDFKAKAGLQRVGGK